MDNTLRGQCGRTEQSFWSADRPLFGMVLFNTVMNGTVPCQLETLCSKIEDKDLDSSHRGKSPVQY
jgi:hypothetical protein